MIKQTITCDMCGLEKGEVNHWYMYDQSVYMALYPWDDDKRDWPSLKHICGQECAHKALDKFFAGITEQKP
jgi:hypothetical protein